MPKIFINYRSDDEPSTAVLLHRELAAHFGAEEVFLGSTAIAPGSDFTRTC